MAGIPLQPSPANLTSDECKQRSLWGRTRKGFIKKLDYELDQQTNLDTGELRRLKS